jgi:hypothetical protein
MRWAVTRACDETGGSIPGPLVGGGGNDQAVLFKEEGDCYTNGPTDGTVALARMLAGDWRTAFRMARDDPFGDWMGTSTARMFILPVMMAWLTGWPEREPPADVAELLNHALALFGVPDRSGSSISQRVRAALAEAMPSWKPVPAAVGAAVVDGCVRLARAGVAAILKSQHHSQAHRAALLATAAAEVLRARRSDAAAIQLVDGVAVKHREDSEFTRELRIRCRQTRTAPVP